MPEQTGQKMPESDSNRGDLVTRLRDRAYSFKAPDPLLEEAANEIERLRVTDEEREAIRYVHLVTAGTREAKTLASILERLT